MEELSMAKSTQTTSPMVLYLKVQQVQQSCLVEMTWGESQRFNLAIAYPEHLIAQYQDWQRAYLNFYRSEQVRGRSGLMGTTSIAVDWRKSLAEADQKLQMVMQRWFNREMYELRSRILQCRQAPEQVLVVSLSCDSVDLARLPWEMWDLGAGLPAGTVQLLRAPLNIDSPTQLRRHRRARILTILGDDTGLDFQGDRQALIRLNQVADVQFVGWQQGDLDQTVLQNITQAIIDPRGWDLLFFAGHSNETNLTGGELGIAPGLALSMRELLPKLRIAQQHGLQAAVFNSCRGLNIAESLIDLGLGQVLVMREPIHNRVAQAFLHTFLADLAQGNHIQAATQTAETFLRDNPQEYLGTGYIASLFCHPQAKLYRIPRSSISRSLRPHRLELAVLVASLLCTLPLANDFLLNARLLAQTFYRQITQQFPPATPPIALVQIDPESIYRRNLSQTELLPISRTYLTEILQKTTQLQAPVVGLDVLLDAPQKNVPDGDRQLVKATQAAVESGQWLVFASSIASGKELTVNAATGIPQVQPILSGYIDADPYRLELPKNHCQEICPIAYIMALVKQSQQTANQLSFKTASRHQLLQQLPPLPWPQMLPPIIDFSLPPDRVYRKIPAWQLLENPAQFAQLQQQVVIIAAASEQMGMVAGQADQVVAPIAMSYMTGQSWLTGGESLAYMTHHFLQRHYIRPIPDLWLIGSAVVIAKLMGLGFDRFNLIQKNQKLIGGSVPILYGIAGLQLYVSAGILLPWFLPTGVFLTCFLSGKLKR
jgi:hypothetical protein